MPLSRSIALAMFIFMRFTVYVLAATSALESDSTVHVNATRGRDATLPASVNYTGNGSCNIRPIVLALQMRIGNTTVLNCPSRSNPCEVNEVGYNIEELGDVIVPSSAVVEGTYIFGFSQDCPTGIIRVTFDLSFTAEGIVCLCV